MAYWVSTLFLILGLYLVLCINQILAEIIFREHFLSNFSKEFYHWLAVSGNEAQRSGYDFGP